MTTAITKLKLLWGDLDKVIFSVRKGTLKVGLSTSSDIAIVQGLKKFKNSSLL